MGTSDGFLVLGGINLNSYCTMKLFSFSILNYGKDASLIEQKPQEPEEEKGEPLIQKNLDKRIEDLNVSPVKYRTNSVYTQSRMGGEAIDENLFFDFDIDSSMYNMWKISAL